MDASHSSCHPPCSTVWYNLASSNVVFSCFFLFADLAEAFETSWFGGERVGRADFMAAFSYSLGGPGGLVLSVASESGWAGVKGICWEMKSMGPASGQGGLGWGLGPAILFAMPILHRP